MNHSSLNGYRYAPTFRAALVATGLWAWLGIVVASTPVFGQIIEEEPVEIPPALSAADAPVPPNLHEFIADPQTAVALGKSLYWDMQAGSDGKTSCASCHFHAGTDNRTSNTLSLPGNPAGVSLRGANAAIKAADFPFHKLFDPNRRASDTNPVLSDTGEVCGSAGVVRTTYLGLRNSALDYGREVPDPVFTWGGANCRQVTARNAPTVINAVFNDRNFWDGRANRFFNGVNPFGDMDLNARVWKFQNGRPSAVRVLIDNASLASQAVGPALNGTEMSWDGRQFPDLGRKLLSLKPLALQSVHPNDSVLGAMANPLGKGLAPEHTYAAMIRKAFRPQWWNAPSQLRIPVGSNKYQLIEVNFALFWGLAIQAYETTLVSDDAKYDRWQRGLEELTQQEQEGFDLFMGEGLCIACHLGPEFTSASVRSVRLLPVEPMLMAAGQLANYDLGYYNIGVRPTTEDLGAGGLSPFGGPLSLTRRHNRGEPLLYENLVNPAPLRATAMDGAFKTPTLRNVELTGPYMHNGGIATLTDVVRFYARRPDFFEQNFRDLAPELVGIPEISDPSVPPADRERKIEALVAFMKTLTDQRVRWQRAPFDHPELTIPHGHLQTVPGVTGKVNVDGSFTLPAVGAEGAAEPLRPFEEMLSP